MKQICIAVAVHVTALISVLLQHVLEKGLTVEGNITYFHVAEKPSLPLSNSVAQSVLEKLLSQESLMILCNARNL